VPESIRISARTLNQLERHTEADLFRHELPLELWRPPVFAEIGSFDMEWPVRMGHTSTGQDGRIEPARTQEDMG
jgi:hypothetical protein